MNVVIRFDRILFLLLICSFSSLSAFGYRAESFPAFQDTNDTWQRIIPDLVSPSLSSSMLLDESGYPHLSYQNSFGSPGLLRYAWYDGSGWEETVVDNTEYCESGILLNHLGDYPRIVYSNSYYDEFRHAWFDGSQWNLEVFWSGGNGLTSTLDSQGNLCVLLLDDSNQVHYGVRSEAEWSFEQIGNATNWPLALVMDSDDTPHAVWSTNSCLFHHWKGSSGWQSEPVISAYIEDIALVADNNDDLHLALQGASDFSYLHRTESGWDEQLIDTMSGNYCAIAVASDGTVHLAYSESNNSDLRYAVSSPAGWSTQVVSWQGFNGLWISLHLDEFENPWICHSRLGTQEIVWWGSETSVEDCTESPILSAVHSPFSIASNPARASEGIKLNILRPGNYIVSLFELSGRLVYSAPSSYMAVGTRLLQNLPENMKDGVYFLCLKEMEQSWTEKLSILLD